MKIGITCYPTFGGSGVIASELAKSLVTKGHTVHIFSYKLPFKINTNADGVFFHEVKDPNYPLFEYPSYGMALACQALDACKKKQIEILHAHYAYPHAISSYLIKRIAKNNLKTVTTLHGTDITLVGKNPLFVDIVKFAIEKSDSVTSVSRFLRDQTINLFQTAKNIKVISNFVDTKIFLPKSKRTYPGKIPVFIHISNFRPAKRSQDMVKTFNLIRRQMKARAILIGDGPDLPKVQRLISKFKLNNEIEIVPPIQNLAPILADADILIITSESESFGLVALEAMSCGIPVVGTTCGGLPECVTHNYNGFLSPVGDIGKLAANCIKLLSNRDLYMKFSENSRKIAVEKFDTNKIVQKYENLYHSLKV